MSVSINLVKAIPTGEFRYEYTCQYQVYDTENIEWFEDYTNNKSYVRDNKWESVQDDFYGKCKPKDYGAIKKYIHSNFHGKYKKMHLKAIDKIEKNDNIFYEFGW